MPRRARIAPGGRIYHVLNRANEPLKLFDSPLSYRQFLRLVAESASGDAMRVLAYCAMPNHWHMLLWPRHDGDLFRFIQRLTIRHTQQWHARNGTAGRGHLYQARYKSFVVQDDTHLLTICRYIERNPVRAGLAGRASSWPWSSASDRLRGLGKSDGTSAKSPSLVELEPLPVELPDGWAGWLEEHEHETELNQLRTHVAKGAPFGDETWTSAVAAQTCYPLQVRPRGRPRKTIRDANDSLRFELD